MKEPIIETYVPQNKRLPYQVAAGVGIAFVVGLIYSPINTQYNYTSFVPIIERDTVYVHKITTLTFPAKEESKKIDEEAYGSRSYGWEVRKLSGEQLRQTLEGRGFRNLKGVDKSKLRRIYIAYCYESMLMNVHLLTDFPISMIYSFFIIEATSAGIETELWRKHANAGGVKALKGQQSVTYKTREVIRGRDKYIRAKFMKASNTEEGMKLWASVLNSGRYADCKKANYKIKGIKLYESICKCVYKSGYHTDRDYKFRASLMAEYWQIKKDNFPLKKRTNEF
ncbi:hypothetical protein UFOVP458_56 [uncultured Caudovirales phage]|uniref:Mannosyl-glycoprotein endo-beta-N-acetylglucosamidase-like domain-containing protein n=1 Tax=uncultured Caudovirales phage TaxID=2100421 RepID=A0A6J5MER8_9CAUD|nr:hypothetical protein UFOVP458_56 [uncultured Caudovirales phage]